MSHLVRARNRVKFHRSLRDDGRPEPISVTVFIRLRDEVHEKNPHLQGILDDPVKREFEMETPQFFYHFVVGAACEERISDGGRHVIIISDCPKTWLELYQKAKATEPKRIGGALALGGETLDDEMRKMLKEKTGGHLPFSLPANSIDRLWEMVFWTLEKAESILIWQRVSLATQKKRDKRDMVNQVHFERCNKPRDLTVWVGVEGKKRFDRACFVNRYMDECPGLCKFSEGKRLRPREELIYRDALLLIADCPKRMVEMYDQAKEEWGLKELDLALIKCNPSKREKKELESHLGGHRPAYYSFLTTMDSGLHEEIFRAIIDVRWRVSYQRMTKAWNLAKIEKKRAEQRSREPIEEDSDEDSLISFDSVDELPSDYEENEGKESDEDEYPDFERHSCAYCFGSVKMNQFFSELINGGFGNAYEEYKLTESKETNLVKWLCMHFDEKREDLDSIYDWEYGVKPSGAMVISHKREAWKHTKGVFKEALGWEDDDEDIEFLMGGLRTKIWTPEELKDISLVLDSDYDDDEWYDDDDDSKIVCLRRNISVHQEGLSESKWSEIRAKVDVVLEDLTKKGIERKGSDDVLSEKNSNGEAEVSDSMENKYCVSEEESDKLLIESFEAIFGRIYYGQKSKYMEKTITLCWNWLHRIFDNKQKVLVKEYEEDNHDPFSDKGWNEIKRKASIHTEILLRKFRKDESDSQIRGYMEGLHEWISKVETGEEQSYFPKEDLPGQRKKALMEMSKKQNNDPSNVKAKTEIQKEAPDPTEVVVNRVIANQKEEQKTVAEASTDLSFDTDEEMEDEDCEEDWVYPSSHLLHDSWERNFFLDSDEESDNEDHEDEDEVDLY